MRLVRLSSDYSFSTFDCGDEDLNDFLISKISKLELTNSLWGAIRDSFPENKRFRSYPSIKIGRFAVSLEYRHKNIGSELLALIKLNLANRETVSAFRFITVDAYLKTIDFYRLNGFHALNRKDEDRNTRLMYFDMLEV